MDRIDIHVEVPTLSYDELRADKKGLSSAEMKKQVEFARSRQEARFTEKASPVNSEMTAKEIKQFCKLDENCELLLKAAVSELGFSARAHSRILKVAKTIADIEGDDNIKPEHLSEAIQYRALDRQST